MDLGEAKDKPVLVGWCYGTATVYNPLVLKELHFYMFKNVTALKMGLMLS